MEAARLPTEEYDIAESPYALTQAGYTTILKRDPTRISCIISPPKGAMADFYVSWKGTPNTLQGVYVNNTTLPLRLDFNSDRALVSGPVFAIAASGNVTITVIEVFWRPSEYRESDRAVD